MDITSTELVGDFISNAGDNFPDIMDSILLQMSVVDLETCRLVSKGWRDYIDQMGTSRARNGRAWAGKNRHVSNHEVFWMPSKLPVSSIVYDQTTKQITLVSTIKCRWRHEHQYTQVLENYLSSTDNERFIWGQRYNFLDNLEYFCADPQPDVAKISQLEEAENPIQGYQVENMMFLKDVIVAIGNRRVFFFNSITKKASDVAMPLVTVSAFSYYTKLVKLGGKYPNGLIVFGLGTTKDNEGTITEAFLQKSAIRYTTSLTFNEIFIHLPSQILPGPYNEGPGFGPGLQILDHIGILSTGLGNVFIFKALGGTEVLPLIKLDISIQLEGKNKEQLCYLKFHLFENNLIATGKTNDFQVIRCFDTGDGSTKWTTFYNSDIITIENLFSHESFLFWSTSSKQGQNVINGWNSATNKMLNEIIIPGDHDLEFMKQPWLKIASDLLIIPMRHKKYPRPKEEHYTLFILNMEHGLVKRIELCIDLEEEGHAQTTTFFIDEDEGNIYFGNCQSNLSESAPEFRLHFLSLKKLEGLRKLAGEKRVILAEMKDMPE